MSCSTYILLPIYFSPYAYSIQYKVSCGVQVSPCPKTLTYLNLTWHSFEDVASLHEHLPQRRTIVPLTQPQDHPRITPPVCHWPPLSLTVMGVNGLWPVSCYFHVMPSLLGLMVQQTLSQVAERCSLLKFAVNEGLQHWDGSAGPELLTISVDAR